MQRITEDTIYCVVLPSFKGNSNGSGTKQATTYTYDETHGGLLSTVQAPAPGNINGTTTVTYSAQYDAYGNPLQITGPGNGTVSSVTTTFNYTADGAYSQATALGQPLTVTDNVGNVTHLRYDAQGNTVSVTDAIGNTTDFGNASGVGGYNIANQPVLVTFPATGQGTGSATATATYSYPDGPHTASTVTDENGNKVRSVTLGYGREDELLSVGGDTDTATYTYDALYRVMTLADGNKNATNYYYNHTGFLYAMTYPGYNAASPNAPTLNGTTGDYSGVSGKDSITYAGWDGDGNPGTRTDGNGKTFTYTRDQENRVTQVAYPANTLPNLTIGYDGYERPITVNNGTTVTNVGYTAGATTYPGYDDDGDALNVQTVFLAANHTATLFSAALGYTYNPDDSRASMTTPAGTFTYAYDADARPSTLTNPFSETSSWAYDNDSRLQSQTLGNGIVTSYAYNPRSFLTDLLNKGGSTTLSEFGGSTPSTAMAYDALGDLTSVKASLPAAPASYSGTTTYQYDGKTELTQEATTRGGGFTHAFGYDPAENPTQFRGGGVPTANADNQLGGTYDGNGNPTGGGFTFDVENRVTNTGSMIETWGANGLRASEGGTYFLYDGSVPVCEMMGTGSVGVTNTFGASGLLSRHTSSGSVFYTFDPMGNVAQRYTSTGSLVSSDLYDSFGFATSTASPTDPFGYEGKFGYYTDSSTGLILCGHRFYDTATGRFITHDPIGYAGGMNLYGYVEDDPINDIDPDGTSSATIEPPVQEIIEEVVEQGGRSVLGPALGTAGLGLGLFLANQGGLADDTLDYQNAGRKQSKTSDKQKSTDSPSWAPNYPRYVGETCEDWATRILNEKYGAGNWGKGADSEYSKLVKACHRSNKFPPVATPPSNNDNPSCSSGK